MDLLVKQLNDNTILSNVLNRLGVLDDLIRISRDSDTDPSKNSKTTELPSASLNDLTSFLYSTLNFLFLPLPFIDNGSFFLNLQSIESPVLYFLYALVLVSLVRYAKKITSESQILVGLLLFVSLFIAQSALLEINLGTLVRHRSILVLCLILIYFEISGKQLSKSKDQIVR